MVVMKNSASYDIMLRIVVCYQLHVSFLLDLHFSPEDGRRYIPPNHRFTLNELHGVILYLRIQNFF
jgi:hypothetical protein